MKARGFRLRVARREAAYLSAVVAIAGIVGLVVAARMAPGAPTVLLTTVSSVLVTLAIGTFIYETLLRDSVAAETIQLLGLKQSVVASGLTDIQPDSNVEWRDLLSSPAAFKILVSTPFGWLEQAWPHILEAGHQRKIDVTVFLLDPSGPHVATLGSRLGREEAELRSQLESFTEHLRSSWLHAKTGHSPLRPGSRLSVKYFDFSAPYDLITTDRDVLVRAHSLVEIRPGDPSLVLHFRAGSGTFPVGWLEAQFEERLKDVGATWENEA